MWRRQMSPDDPNTKVAFPAKVTRETRGSGKGLSKDNWEEARYRPKEVEK